MKTLTRGMWSFFLVLVFNGIAMATPTYYIARSNVAVIQNDGTGVIHDSGISAGTEVSYTFLIDFAVQGYIRLNDGTIAPVANSFYVDYISGNALAKNGGVHNSGTDVAEYNYGFFEYDNGHILDTYLNVNSSDNHLALDIYSWDPSISAMGGSFAGTFGNTVYNSSGQVSSLVGASFNIVDPPAPEPVPEPSTYLLLGCGMLPLLIKYRKRYQVI